MSNTLEQAALGISAELRDRLASWKGKLEFLDFENPNLTENTAGYSVTIARVLLSSITIQIWCDFIFDGETPTYWIGFGAESIDDIERLVAACSPELHPYHKVYSRNVTTNDGSEITFFKDSDRARLFGGPILESFGPNDFSGLGIYRTDDSLIVRAGTDFIDNVLRDLIGGDTKYAPISAFLKLKSRTAFSISLLELEKLVYPLPKDARTPQFWANTHYHPSRRSAWLNVAFEAFFEPKTDSVRFEPIRVLSPEGYEKAVSNALLNANGGSGGPPAPNEVFRVQTVTTRYSRGPAIAAHVRRLAKGKCECCGHDAPFDTDEGLPFLEAHHLRRLADGGPDSIDNAVAVCPNCHRRLHYGKDRQELCDEIIERIGRLKSYPFVSDFSPPVLCAYD